MGEVVRLVTKAERERARLIRQARANYDSIFPPAGRDGELRADHSGGHAQPSTPKEFS
ncbi:hypothetical protein RAD16_24740 [Bradyrhizobium sp. 18BD]